MENVATGLKDLWDQVVSTVVALGINPASVWFYIQLGLIVFAFLMGKLVQGVFNKRVDINERLMGLPWALRRFLRMLVQNIWLVIFILVVISARAVLLAYTWPSRSYLLFVAIQLAIAWLFIHLIATVIRNAVAYRVAVISAWTIAALSILNLLERTTAALNSFGVQLG